MVMDRVSHKTKIDVFENAFRKIKEVSNFRKHSELLSRKGGGGEVIEYHRLAGPHLAFAAAGWGEVASTLNTTVAPVTFENKPVIA